MTELGGENSERLLLGGLLADLSVEHYDWVSGGDKGNPDTSTTMARFERFLHRLDVLFMDGMILRLPESYTGVTLKFLEETSYYHFGKRVQCFGLGNMKEDAAAQGVVRATLRRVQQAIANMKELGKVYRPFTSWFQAFEAFALPSPLSAASAEAEQEACRASLERIAGAAKLPFAEAFDDWKLLLARAEVFNKTGATTREAWGRASAEFPELQRGRDLVECYLIWKTSTGNVERRFREYKEFADTGRAQLLDTTTESCMVALQGPPSKLLNAWINEMRAPAPAADAARGQRKYLAQVQTLHDQRHGHTRTWKAGQRAQRRDAGVSRPASSNGPETEASFARKRKAAIDGIVQASPEQRARVMTGMDWLRQGTPTPSEATAACAARVQKRAADEEERHLRGEARAAKARKKLQARVIRPQVKQRSAGHVSELPSVPAGVALVRDRDQGAASLARRLHFSCTNDPAEFVRLVVAASATRHKHGHLALAPVAENSDFATCARVVAVLLGTYFADARDFVEKGKTSGCQYIGQWKRQTATYKLALSPELTRRFPTLPAVLRAVAAAPNSAFEFHSEDGIKKLYKKEIKQHPRLAKNLCVLATEAERDAAAEKVRPVYQLRMGFYRMFSLARESAVCPGFKDD